MNIFSRSVGIAGILLFHSFAGAALPQFQGSYSFQGKINLLTALEVRHLYVPTVGEKAVDELNKQGFTCRAEDNGWWGCRKMHDDWKIPNVVLLEMNKKYQQKLNVQFMAPQQKPILGHESGDLQMWKYFQPLKWNGQNFEFLWLYHTPQVNKIVFGGNELVVSDASNTQILQYVDSKDIEFNNGIDWVTYYVMMVLEPVKR